MYKLLPPAQLQVILKPDPGNPQEVYLGSLEALGIDTSAHDVRFVEDNWESPVLGAWGLGWEVWLDGMEITQARFPAFTYFPNRDYSGDAPLRSPTRGSGDCPDLCMHDELEVEVEGRKSGRTLLCGVPNRQIVWYDLADQLWVSE